eukprot:m.42173 g.42173  ORF g.42173 m.42173 type:complete len:298 (-) comp5707_c0_seq1:127-1020(-)
MARTLSISLGRMRRPPTKKSCFCWASQSPSICSVLPEASCRCSCRARAGPRPYAPPHRRIWNAPMRTFPPATPPPTAAAQLLAASCGLSDATLYRCAAPIETKGKTLCIAVMVPERAFSFVPQPAEADPSYTNTPLTLGSTPVPTANAHAWAPLVQLAEACVTNPSIHRDIAQFIRHNDKSIEQVYSMYGLPPAKLIIPAVPLGQAPMAGAGVGGAAMATGAAAMAAGAAAPATSGPWTANNMWLAENMRSMFSVLATMDQAQFVAALDAMFRPEHLLQAARVWVVKGGQLPHALPP